MAAPFLVPLFYFKSGGFMDKLLLTIDEVCEVTGFGATKVRQLLNRPDSKFTVRLGRKLYANKKLLEEYLDNCARYQITI